MKDQKNKEKNIKRTKKPEDQSAQDRKYKEYIDQKIQEFNTNGKLTIAYFCDTFYPIIDGVIKVMDNYATLLNGEYNIVMIVPKHKNIIVKKDYLVIGTASMYFKFVNYDLALPDMDAFLAQTIRKLRIDLVHAHSPFNMGSFASKVAKKKKVPFVMTMHSQFKMDFMKYTNSELLTSYLLKQITRVFGRSTEVWTMHEGVKKALESYGYKGKFYFVPNATDYEDLGDAKQMQEHVNKKYKIKEEDFVMLFVGRLVEQKNIFFIADVLKKVKDSGRKFKMIFVGDGPDKKTLQTQIKNLGLTEDVILTGKIMNQKEIQSIYARSNLFLFPSLYDTSSLVQIEAASYKTPTVFIENTVTSATVTNNVNGFTCENNVDAFANKVMEIYDNPELLQKIGENAFKDLYITWSQVAKRVSERYQYLIAQNKNKQAKLKAIKNAKMTK